MTYKYEFRKNNFICLSILESSFSCCVLYGTAGVDCLISITLNFHHLSIRYAGKCWEAGILKIICMEFFGDPWSKLFEPISLLLHGFSLSVWAMYPWVRKIEFLVPYFKLLCNCFTYKGAISWHGEAWKYSEEINLNLFEVGGVEETHFGKLLARLDKLYQHAWYINFINMHDICKK